MYKIEVRHSCIVINNYNLGDSTNIEKFFSVWDKVRHQAFPKAIRYDEETKTLYLPRGVDIPFVERNIGANAKLIEKCDKAIRMDQLQLKCLPRDDVQREAIRFILGEGEYTYTKAKSQLCINLNPGEGKTYLSVAVAAYLGLTTAMITSSLEWIRQWDGKIQEYTTATPKEIYTVAGASSIAKLLNGMVDHTKIRYFLFSHSTLQSYGNRYGWDKVGELFKFLGIGLKLYDEAHLDFDNICKIDFATNTYKTLYLTATPARSDRDENKIYQASFRNVPALDLFDEERDPRTNYVAIHFNSHPTAQEIQMCRGAYGFNIHAYIDYVVHRPNFYKLIYILANIIRKRGKTLIYIGTIKAINFVYEWMNYNLPEFRGQIGVYNSSVPKELKPAQLDKRIILSTTKSCGAASDIPGLMLTIVLADPFTSEVIARQTLGRTRARDTMYIDIVDKAFSALVGYYKHKQGIFGVYALSNMVINFMDNELEARYQKCLAERQSWYCDQYQSNNYNNIELKTVVERVKVQNNE